MIEFLTIGAVLGLTAGLSPGPLLTLLICETIRHNSRSGMMVAFSPMVTDLPIILFSLLVLSRLTDFQHILGIISLLGALVIFMMGYQNMNPGGIEEDFEKAENHSFSKGLLVNILNPHVYLFWFSVGAPIMSRATGRSLACLLTFIGSFYFMLVGSKILLAVVVGRSKTFLGGALYVNLMRFLGIALFLLAVMLFRDGLKLLGLIGS